METGQYLSRFDRIVARDIDAETADECRTRLWHESLGRPIVYTEAEVAQMKRSLKQQEKEAQEREEWHRESRRILRELAA